MIVIFAPRDGFLPYLAAGWTFANGVAQPMPGAHGAWSVMLEREA
jgi:hypothetical protein